MAREAGTGAPRGWTYAAMSLHVALAAGTYVFGKPGVTGFGDPAALCLARALGACALCLALTGWAVPAPRFSFLEWLEVAALGALLVPLNQYLFLVGLHDTVPSHPALIYAMTPVGVVALSAALERRPPPRAWLAGIALSVAGVLLVLEPWNRDAALSAVRFGDLMIFAGLLVWVVYTVWAAKLSKRMDPRTVTVWTLVLGTLFFVPIGAGPLLRTDFASLSGKTWFGVLWLAAVTSVVMMLLWNWMLRRIGPVQVAVCANAQPVATALLAWALASAGWLTDDQRLGWVFWAGTAAVVAGVVVVQRGDRVKNSRKSAGST